VAHLFSSFLFVICTGCGLWLAGPRRIPTLVVAKGLSGAFSLKEFIESPNAAPNFAYKVLFI